MMDKVIVAFENEKSSWRIKEILESAGAAECMVCHSAAEVKRAAGKLRIAAVVCGYKLPDQSAEGLFDDLPASCAMLMVAVQSLLNLCASDEICKLPSPVSRGDLLSTVRMLLQTGGRPERSAGEQGLIEQAKALLMDRHGMTEAQAHRFLQKKSMDSGLKLAQAAQMVLDRH